MTADRFDRISAEITEEEAAQEEFRAAPEHKPMIPVKAQKPLAVAGGTTLAGLALWLYSMQGAVAQTADRIAAVDAKASIAAMASTSLAADVVKLREDAAKVREDVAALREGQKSTNRQLDRIETKLGK